VCVGANTWLTNETFLNPSHTYTWTHLGRVTDVYAVCSSSPSRATQLWPCCSPTSTHGSILFLLFPRFRILVSLSKNRGYVQITLRRMTHTSLPHSGHTHTHTRWYHTQVNRGRGAHTTNGKEYSLESLMFQQMVEFFFIVTATGNRDKQENNKNKK
jgi:hypothetical protein